MKTRFYLALALAGMLTGCAVAPRFDPQCATETASVLADFDGAARGECRVSAEGSFTLVISPEDPPPINDSAWYAFQVVANESETVQVTLQYIDGHHRYWPKVSRDGRTWTRLDESQVSVAEDRSAAVLSLPADRKPWWIAGQELLMPEMIDREIRDLGGSLGLELELLGESAQGRPIHRLDTRGDDRETLLIVGRQHPPEITGSVALTPFVAALLADNDAARQFRQRFRVVVVPFMNPDGVILGYWRHNTGGVDLNRDWGPFTQPETRLLKNLVDELVADGNRIRVFLDFHSTQRNLFYTQNDADVTVPVDFATRWLDAARPRMVNYEFTQEKRPNNGRPTSKNYMYDRFGIPAITYEMGDETDRDAIRHSAGVFAEELMTLMLATPAEEFDQPLYDVLIKDGLVYDGSRAAPRRGNIAIRHGRIISMDAPDDVLTRQTIDAGGKAVVPGFIDPHTHAREDLRSGEAERNLNYITQGVTTVFLGNDGYGVQPPSRAALEQAGLPTNVAILAGHGGIRKDVMGMAERAPTPEELEAMKQQVASEMEQGAFGLSSGLFYAPGSYADIDEVVELARVAARYGGLYETHMRSESSGGVGLLGALEEALEIGRRAELPVHIAHIKALGKAVWGQSEAMIALIEQAQAAGQIVTADQYPWQASGTRFSNALVPRRIMAGSADAMLARLNDPAVVNEIRTEMETNLALRGGPEAMLVTGAESPFVGMTLGQIAAELNLPPVLAGVRMVLEGDPPIASFVMQPADIHALAVRPWVMTGSDGSRGHPRKFATYPKAYQEFVVNHELMSIQQWVHRSSGLVADSFGFCDRGYLRPGWVADIAVLDLASFQPVADYRSPTELSTGVEDLLVDGVSVIRNGEVTDAQPGQIIQKNQQNCPR